MEAVIKFNIVNWKEQDLVINGDTKVKFQEISDEHIKELIKDIISEAIVDNRLYYDFDDAESAVQEISPTISSIILNPLFEHIKTDYDLLIELVTYLTVRLA